MCFFTFTVFFHWCLQISKMMSEATMNKNLIIPRKSFKRIISGLKLLVNVLRCGIMNHALDRVQKIHQVMKKQQGLNFTSKLFGNRSKKLDRFTNMENCPTFFDWCHNNVKLTHRSFWQNVQMLPGSNVLDFRRCRQGNQDFKQFSLLRASASLGCLPHLGLLCHSKNVSQVSRLGNSATAKKRH